MVNMKTCLHTTKTPKSDLVCPNRPGGCPLVHQMFVCDECSKVIIFPPTHSSGALVNNWAWSAHQ